MQGPSIPLTVVSERVKWFQPVTLVQLLSLRNQYPQHELHDMPQYRLVVGNTEIGKDSFL